MNDTNELRMLSILRSQLLWLRSDPLQLF